MTGWQMLFYKEVLRFWRVAAQTITGPVLTAMLYLLVFGQALESHVKVYDNVSYTAFLVPGLAMMSLLQNAFANSSSSLIASKVMGNMVFLLLTPLSPWHWFVAYVGAAVVRGLVVGLGVLAVALIFAVPPLTQPLWAIAFAVLGAALMGALGVVAGLWSEKFDHLAAFQSFVVMPMTFLSGVFYSIHSLPPFWQTVSQFNPFFYMIDGFRYGFTDHADGSILAGVFIILALNVILMTISYLVLRSGWRLKS